MWCAGLMAEILIDMARLLRGSIFCGACHFCNTLTVFLARAWSRRTIILQIESVNSIK